MSRFGAWWDGALTAADPEELPEVQEVRKWGRRGAALALGSVVILLLWGFLVPLDSAVVGQGLLKVENYRQVVQHQEGGIVKAILVHNGDQVKKGQPLLIVEDLRVSASFDLLEQQYLSELAKNSRLQAERAMAPEIKWPEMLMSNSRNPLIPEIRNKERDLFAQRRSGLLQQLTILNRQIGEVTEEIEATARQVAADRAGSKTMREEVQANRKLIDQGFIAPTRMLSLDRTEADYASKQAEHEADLARAKQKLSDLQIRQQNLKDNYRETAVKELRESTDQLNDLTQKVKPALDARDRQQVLAPEDGLVVDLRVHTLGATVGPRDVLMEIVPEGQELIAELKLPVESVSDLKVGMPADVRLLAFQHRTTPVVEGRLVYVSADALAETQSPGQPPYYLAQIRLDAKSLKDADLDPLQAGMPVEAYLKAHRRSTIGYFMDPVFQSLGRAFRER